MAKIMHAKNTVAGSQAECYITIDGTRYNIMHGINFKATIDKTKTEVPILGKTGKGHKTTGWNGTFEMTVHYVSSVFRDLLVKYKNSGEDVYFDIQVSNEDGTSAVGRQTIVFKDCNLDGGVLAMFDADAEYLTEDLSGTFEDFEMPETFSTLEGMI